MNDKKEQFTGTDKKRTAAAIALAIAATTTTTTAGRSASWQQAAKENQRTTTQSRFYCNIKALTPKERAHHKQLSEKLLGARKATVETEKGYEFQFGPEDATLAELADWVVAESKCCPFFDFHIDLENEGKLICLRLTGEEGVKQFMRAEFGIR